MKHQLFISYSDFDKDKVEIIVKELEDHYLFAPLVIAANREALKPLAEKVINGISASSIFIPIMTAKSIQTQWINQEIGYAKAIDKNITPLVENTILKDLKGFIHKEIDLPYNFANSSTNEDFLRALRILISDLEINYSVQKVEVKPEKSVIEQSLAALDEVTNKMELSSKKQTILNSEKGLDLAREEVLNMFNYIKEKLFDLEAKNIRFGREEEQYEPTFIFKAEGFSCSIIFKQKYSNSLSESALIIDYWNGHFTKKDAFNINQNINSQRILQITYQFALDDKMKNCWIPNNDKKNYYYSNLIADKLIAWILNQITEKRQKEFNL